MFNNLNPDFSKDIRDSLGSKTDPTASANGNFSLISLIKRGIGLLTVPNSAIQKRVSLLKDTSTILAFSNPNTKEVVIYNIGSANVSICLGMEVASEEEKSYSLGVRILVVEAFSGTISAIAQNAGEVIVTIKT